MRLGEQIGENNFLIGHMGGTTWDASMVRGGGPLCGVSVSNILGMSRCVIPRNAAAFCAKSMFYLDIGRDCVRPDLRNFDQAKPEEIRALLEDMKTAAMRDFVYFNVNGNALTFELTARMQGSPFKVNRIEAGSADVSAARIATRETFVNGKRADLPIYDADGNALAVPEGILHRLLSPKLGVKHIREKFGDDIHPGDVFLANTPDDGAAHLPDWVYIRPVFCEGELTFFAVMGVHVADNGGAQPGSNFMSFDNIPEGFSIPLGRIVKAGEWNNEVVADSDGKELTRPITVRAKLTVSSSDLYFDFSDTDPETGGMLNIHDYMTCSDCCCCSFMFFGRELLNYHNEGSCRPIHLKTKPAARRAGLMMGVGYIISGVCGGLLPYNGVTNVIFVFVFFFTTGSNANMVMSHVMSLYCPRDYPVIWGRSAVIMQIFTVTAPIILSTSLRLTQGYRGAYAAFAVASLAGTILIFFSASRIDKEPGKKPTAQYRA